MNIQIKTILFLLVLIVCAGETTPILAQKKAKPKEVIMIELTVGRGTKAQMIEVPINYVPRTTEKPLKRGWDKDGDGALPPQFSYNLEAYINDKNSSKVYFAALVERCQEAIRQNFTVMRNQKTEFELGCEIKITARYAIESKDKSFLLKSN